MRRSTVQNLPPLLVSPVFTAWAERPDRDPWSARAPGCDRRTPPPSWRCWGAAAATSDDPPSSLTSRPEERRLGRRPFLWKKIIFVWEGSIPGNSYAYRLTLVWGDSILGRSYGCAFLWNFCLVIFSSGKRLRLDMNFANWRPNLVSRPNVRANLQLYCCSHLYLLCSLPLPLWHSMLITRTCNAILFCFTKPWFCSTTCSN